MKRISPALFLTLAAAIVLNDQTSFAQSQSVDMAPGPIAELLPKSDNPLKEGFDYLDSALEPNRLPAVDRQPQQKDSNSFRVQETNPLPPAAPQHLFDTPAQPRSTDSLINSTPPKMPSAAVAIPAAPGSFYPGSTPVGASQFVAGREVVHSPAPFTAPREYQTAAVVSTGDCGCDTCGEGEIVFSGDCGSCNSSDEAFYDDGVGCESYADCDLAECSQPEEGFYDTGADRIDGNSSRRRGHKGIFSRHREKHLAKKERRARRSEEDERYYEEDQYAAYRDEDDYYQEPACDIEDNYGAAPAVASDNRGQVNGSNVNTTIGVFGLYFQRDYEDNRQFSGSRFPNERGLFSNDADEDDFGGYDINLTRRKANGNGFEARYFSFEPSRETATLGGGPFTTLGATSPNDPAIFLSGVGVPNVDFGGGVFSDATAANVFNFAEVHQVTRETSISNVEFNVLRLGRTGQRQQGAGRSVSHEYLFGFRYFTFDESFGYNAQAFRPNTIASDLLRADYLNEVTNTLYGGQIGGRTEIGFLRKFSLIIGTKAGVYNNEFANSQSVTLTPRGQAPITAQVLGGPNSGQAFDTEGRGTDVTMLAEVDLGLTYQMFSNSRLRVGYRALFVSDVAFAVPQTEVDFSDLNAVQNPTSNDDLFLYGGYFGAEFAF